MRNAILLTLIGVFVVSMITIGAAYALPNDVPTELSPIASSQEQTEIDRSGCPYLLKTYDGKLAMFTTDLVVPEMVFDIYVKNLPLLDQQELARGVRVESYDKLTALIEDYIS